jgi:hypothetical protein
MATVTVDGIVYTVITTTVSGPFTHTSWTGAGSPPAFMIGAGFTSVNYLQQSQIITDVYIGNGVTTIGDLNYSLGIFAFQYCINLKTVIFESGSALTTIGASAFYNTTFASITLPASLQSIGVRAFAKPPNHSNTMLSSVTFEVDSALLIGGIGYKVFERQTSLTISAYSVLIGQQGWSTTSSNTIGDQPGITVVELILPPSPTCFPSGTPVQTDQGEIRIEKITEAHSIRGAPVLAVTRSTGHKNIIQIPRSALYPNVPSQDTYCSLEHKIFHNRRMTKARDLVNKCEHVTKVPYAGGSLFNVLLPTHSRMVVNNLVVETLHPRNAAARLPAPTSRR